MKEILSVYGITKETVDAIMILYHDTSSMVRSPGGDTDFFDNSAGVLQGDKLAPCIFIICLDYVLRKALDKNNELGFALAKRKRKRDPANLKRNFFREGVEPVLLYGSVSWTLTISGKENRRSTH